MNIFKEQRVLLIRAHAHAEPVGQVVAAKSSDDDAAAEQFAMNWVYTVLLEPKCFPFQTEGGIKLPHKKKRKERKHVQENQTASEAV